MSRLQVPDRSYTETDMKDWAHGLAKRFVSGRFTWTPGLVGANSQVDTTLTTADAEQVRDITTTMAIALTAPASLDAGLSFETLTSAARDQLTIRVTNTTGGGITPAAGEWKFFAWQT